MKINHDRRRQNPAIRTLKILTNNAHTNARDVHFPQTPEDSFGVHPSYRHRTMRAVVCALWVLTTASCAHAAASFTNLTWFPGNNFNYNTTGVSGDGSVVVGTSGEDTSYDNNFYTAFRWTAGSGMVSLGGYESFASGVSGDGSVIIGNGGRWTAGSGWVSLGHLPGGTGGGANGISADGSVIVGSGSSTSGNQAFRWTAGSGMVGLGYLPGTTNSSAAGVSADGSIIVGTSGSQAFRWTAGTGMVGLGYLPGGNSSSASGVSADGSGYPPGGQSHPRPRRQRRRLGRRGHSLRRAILPLDRWLRHAEPVGRAGDEWLERLPCRLADRLRHQGRRG